MPLITLKPDALKGMQWPLPPHDYVGELKAKIDQIKAASQPKPQPEPAPVAPVEVTPEPEPKSEPVAPSRPLTPQEMALRERVLNAAAIPRPPDAPLMQHAYGLIHDEDVEIPHGDRLPSLYEMGETHDTLLKSLKAYSREDLNLLWPDLFPLGTGSRSHHERHERHEPLCVEAPGPQGPDLRVASPDEWRCAPKGFEPQIMQIIRICVTRRGAQRLSVKSVSSVVSELS